MKTVYTLIRIPKCGTQSFEVMVRNSLPESTYYRIPQYADIDYPLETNFEKFKYYRSIYKRAFVDHRVFSEKALWDKINNTSEDGDIISGHFTFGRPKLPDCDLQYITLLRDPVARLVSGYNYAKEGYHNRSWLRKMYRTGYSKTAGTQTFHEYLSYMAERPDRYSNPATAYITGNRFHDNPWDILNQHYFHFGILERMDLFSEQLAKKLNFTVEEIWKNKTKKKNEFSITDADNEIINRLLGTDIKLYEQVRRHILG